MSYIKINKPLTAFLPIYILYPVSDRCIVYKTISDKTSYILALFGSMKYEYTRRKKNTVGFVFFLFLTLLSSILLL